LKEVVGVKHFCLGGTSHGGEMLLGGTSHPHRKRSGSIGAQGSGYRPSAMAPFDEAQMERTSDLLQDFPQNSISESSLHHLP